MPERELYRKAFSAMHLVETLVGGILGGDNSPSVPTLDNPYSNVENSTFMGM